MENKSCVAHRHTAIQNNADFIVQQTDFRELRREKGGSRTDGKWPESPPETETQQQKKEHQQPNIKSDSHKQQTQKSISINIVQKR